MSPIQDKAENEQVELEAFELKRVKKTSGVEVLQCLEKRNKAYIIDTEPQQ